MDIRTEIYLNQVAQGISPEAEGLRWFMSLPTDEERQDTLRWLAHACDQAGVVDEDIEPAVVRSGISPDSRPVQVLQDGMPKDQVWKVARLSMGDWVDCFRLLLATLSVSDGRRRKEFCSQGCSHWWHKNLADMTLVEHIATHPHLY